MAAATTMAVTTTTPRTRPVPTRLADDPLPKFLGWFSIGLGLAEVLAPRALGRLIGVGDHPAVMTAYGLREIAAGVGILANPSRSGPWLAARVAGDALDIASLFRAWMDANEGDRLRIVSAGIAVAGVTALDIYAANKHGAV